MVTKLKMDLTRRGIKAGDLAAWLGVTSSTVSMFCTGTRKPSPEVQKLIDIYLGFGCWKVRRPDETAKQEALRQEGREEVLEYIRDVIRSPAMSNLLRISQLKMMADKELPQQPKKAKKCRFKQSTS